MRQIWLSSTERGICIPNLGRFLVSNNLVKIDNLGGIFTGQEITPLDICHTNLSIRSLVTVEIFLSRVHPFLALLLNLGQFIYFVPPYTWFLLHLLGSKK